MNTLNLNEAATFLNCHSETLRRQAKQGLIPGRKAGKCWVFIEEHLADWVSGRYPDQGRELRVIDKQMEAIKCQSINVVKIGGYNSPHQVASEYNALLGLK